MKSITIFCKAIGLYLLFSIFLFPLKPVAALDVFIPEGNPAVTLEGMLLGARGIAVDRNANIWVADTQNHVIRKYLPDGTPTAVLGQETVEGNQDGSPSAVRFSLPFRLAIEPSGDILVADDNSKIRRINYKTLVTETIADLSLHVDGSLVYNIIGQITEDDGQIDDLRIGDITPGANGDIFVNTADRLGIDLYLVRIRNGIKKALISSHIVNPNAAKGSRGIASDAAGNIFVSFPSLSQSGNQPDHVFYLPGGDATGMTVHCQNVGFHKCMGMGLGERLYLTSGITTAPIKIISAQLADTSLGELQVIQPFTSLDTQQIRDIAVGPQGTLYAVNGRSIDGKGIPTPAISKVDRFPNIDKRIGADAGDIILPAVSMTAPADQTIITDPVILQAEASDNSGVVSVQFLVDDKSFGPQLLAPPFACPLDPALLSGGNHIVQAIATDGAGNSSGTSPVLIHTSGGLANTQGEIFLSDLRVNTPFGVATDRDGNVYLADGTRLTSFSVTGRALAVYGSESAGRQDGSASTVRFAGLKGLGRDSQGRILMVDHVESTDFVPGIRRLDPATGITSTVSLLDDTADIDVSQVFNVTSGTFEDLIAINSMCSILPCHFGIIEAFDVAGAPNGDIFIGTARGYGIQLDPFHYILRYRQTGLKAIARADITYGQMDSDRQARSVAIDASGNLYAAFPQGMIIADHDALFRFPDGFPSGTTLPDTLIDTLDKSEGLAVDSRNRLYISQSARNGTSSKVNIVSTTQADTVLQVLDARLLNNIHDIFIDDRDNVYVTSSETRFFGNIPYVVYRVTRYCDILSSQTLPDSDNDGISDHADLCPDTPQGETVDASGCSPDQKDTDGDGVPDSSDLCPGTPAGSTPDANGCSPEQRDTDNDGVSDHADLCPDTPQGETVDANGCSPDQKDTDGDGVPDSSDLCPGTPAGSTPDANGCSPEQRDTDNDGVSDHADLCPDTPQGATVDASGCSPDQKDTDGDGVPDSSDLCPDTPLGNTVGQNGCSILKGDLNQDGKIRLDDSILGIEVLTGQPNHADGGATVSDSTRIGLTDCIHIVQTVSEKKPVIKSIDITNEDFILYKSSLPVQLEVLGLFSDGSQKDVTLKTAGTRYTSSNPELVSVSEDGLIRVVSVAEYKTLHIFAVNDNKRDEISVTVNPVETSGELALGQSAADIALYGDHAYLSTKDNIAIIDISDRSAPSLIGVFGQGQHECHIHGFNLIMPYGNGHKIGVYDLKNPTAPELIGSTQEGYDNAWPSGGFLIGNTYFQQTIVIGERNWDQKTVFVRADVLSYDLSDNRSPVMLDILYNTAHSSYPSYPGGEYYLGAGEAVSKDIALIPSTTVKTTGYGGTGNLLVVDISDPSRLEIINTLEIPGTTLLTGIAVQGNKALVLGNTGYINRFVQNGKITLTLLDISTPRSPSISVQTIVTDLDPKTGYDAPPVPVSGPDGLFAAGRVQQQDTPVILLAMAPSTQELNILTVPVPSVVTCTRFAGSTLFTTSQTGFTTYNLSDLVPETKNSMFFEKKAPNLDVTMAVSRPGDYISLEYHPGLTHCTDVSFDIYLNGTHIQRAKDVRPEERVVRIPLPNNLLSATGNDLIALKNPVCPTGIGCCTDGQIKSWAGSLNITTREPNTMIYFEKNSPEDLNFSGEFNFTGSQCRITYSTGAKHCTAVRFDLYLNGEFISKLGPVQPGETTDAVEFPQGVLLQGKNRLEFKNASCTESDGCCQNGTPNSWGGLITLFVD